MTLGTAYRKQQKFKYITYKAINAFYFSKEDVENEEERSKTIKKRTS